MRKNLLILFFFFCATAFTFAQKSVEGTVKDGETGEPMPGVSVSGVGSTIGTITDIDGKFKFKISGEIAKLKFSFIGYATQEIKIGDKTEFSVTMLTSAKQVDEIVVTGYSSARKESLVGSVTVVDNESLKGKNVSSVSQALAGEVAGVHVVNTSGQPGSNADIRIRGFGSINGSVDPLYIVDGVPFDGDLSSINPSDIASTTILKDASATSIYGSRGANGVILITTKSGNRKEGKIDINFSRGINYRGLPEYDMIESPEEYTELSWDILRRKKLSAGGVTEQQAIDYANATLFNTNGGISPTYNMWNVDGSKLINSATGKFNAGVARKYTPENWEDEAFQSSDRTELGIRFSGGNDKAKYYTSLGYLKDVGYAVGSDFKRMSVRSNLDFKPKEWIKTNLNLSYANSESNSGGQQEDLSSVFLFARRIPPIYPVYLRDKEGKKIIDPVYGGYQYDYGLNGRAYGSRFNPIGSSVYNTDVRDRHSLSLTNSYVITFTDYLSYETRLGYQYQLDKRSLFRNPTYGSSSTSNGEIFKYDYGTKTFNLLNMIKFNKDFGDHHIDALAAIEKYDYEYSTQTVTKKNLLDYQGTELNNAIETRNVPKGYVEGYNLLSYFGNINYNLQNKYFLSATLRRDGSSRFKGDNKWGNFGSVGASWIISKEKFMDSLDEIYFLKLRTSIGTNGQQAGIGFYPADDLYEIKNDGGKPAYTLDTKGNPDLTWEKSRIFEIGADASFFKDKLKVTMNYYDKFTDNMFFDKRISPSSGIAIITVNDGEMSNKGFEFNIKYAMDITDDLSFDVFVNGETFSNELLKMPLDASGAPKLLDVNTIYGRAEGHSIYDFYIQEYAGVNPDNGFAQWTMYYHDKDGNGKYEKANDTKIQSLYQYKDENPGADIKKTTTETYGDASIAFIGKSAIPDLRGAFGFGVDYKGISLSAQFIYSMGGYGYDASYAGLMKNGANIGADPLHTDVRNRWQKKGDITDVPAFNGEAQSSTNSTSSRFIRDASYLALNNVKLSYQVNPKWLEKLYISGLNVWVSGDNLFLSSDKDGYNPATHEAGRSDVYRYSPLSTVTAGFSVQF